MTDSIELAAPPLQNVVPSYPFREYSDDPNIVAFFTAYNQLAQGYLTWVNQTPLGVYTSPNVSGPLLDWIGQGIYGIVRPSYAALQSAFLAGLASLPLATVAIAGNELLATGAGTLSSDDFYKRLLTWWLYVGDGRRFTIMTLRKKIARFIYGVNGTDVTVAQAQSISIAVSGYQAIQAGLAAVPLASVPVAGSQLISPRNTGQYIITVPHSAGASALYFQQAFGQGLLAFPFQIAATVVVA